MKINKILLKIFHNFEKAKYLLIRIQNYFNLIGKRIPQGVEANMQHHSKRVRTPVALLRSLSD